MSHNSMDRLLMSLALCLLSAVLGAAITAIFTIGKSFTFLFIVIASLMSAGIVFNILVKGRF